MKNLLILLFVTGSIICTGQEESQKSFQNSIAISGGFGLYHNTTNRYGLAYQRELKNNWRIQGGAYIEENIWLSNDSFSPYFIDSILIQVNNFGRTSMSILKIGGMKTFFDRFFIGAEFNIGYGINSSRRHYYSYTYSYHYDSWNDESELNEGDTLQNMSFGNTPYYITPNTTVNSYQNITRYLLYGLSLNIGIQLPIYNRWDLVLQYSPQFLMARSLGSNGNGLGTGVFGHAADLMLRFKF